MNQQEESQKRDVYFNYLDTSEVFTQYYKSEHVQTHNPNGDESQVLNERFLEIDQFINAEHESPQKNTPLILKGPGGFGKKHLLFNWIQYHQENSRKKYKDIIITHVAQSSNGQQTSYFYAIYNILNKIREQLDMSQKIEILEEKLRKYFLYFLDNAISKIKQQIVNDQNIIIIIDGVDQFQDSTGKELSAKFWLPRFFPIGVKIILALENEDSLSYLYFQQREYQVIEIEKDNKILNQIVDDCIVSQKYNSQEQQDQIVQIVRDKLDDPDNEMCALGVKLFIGLTLINDNQQSEQNVKQIIQDLDLEGLKTTNNIEQIMFFLLDFYKDRIMNEQKFLRLLYVLMVVQKGLSEQELISLVNISVDEFNTFKQIFSSVIIRFDDIYCCCHQNVKKIIMQYVSSETPINQKQIYEDIADTLSKTQTSVRKLEEQIHALFQAKSYFILKEIISDIEQFLLLYTSNNKFQLFRYWQKLEEQGFDPSIEYNKALEVFEMHYHPNSEDLFQIIFQMSRFLKDFSDFETSLTPDFRHPPIVGNKEIQEIGLLSELQQMHLQVDVNDRRSMIVLNDIERLNVDIPTNYQTVQQFYISKMKNECSSVQQFLDNTLDDNYDQDSIDDNLNLEEIKNTYQKIQQRKMINSEKLVYKQNIINEENTQSYYYYKRFLWMIFPSACISDKSNCNYSQMIMRCYTSPTQYMSVNDEKLNTNKSILLILEAQLKKRQTYEKPELLKSFQNYLEQFKQDLKHLNSKSQNNKQNEYQSDSVKIQHRSSIRNARSSLDKTNLLEQSKILNKDNNNLFLTMENSIENTYDERQLKNKNVKFKKVEIGETNHYSSVSVLNKSRLFGNQVQSFKADFSKLQDTNQESSNKFVLPRLKQQINVHSQQEIQTLLQKNTYFVRQYNQLKYQNQQYDKELANVKIQQQQVAGAKNREEKVKLLNKIQSLSQNYKQVENHFFSSNKQKERMKKIIFICKQNTKQNEVYIRDLNYLLQNIQKLMKIQKTFIGSSSKDLQELQKLNEEMYELCTQRMNNETDLIQQIKNDLTQKQMFDSKYLQADEYIERSLVQQNEDIEQQNLNKQKSLRMKNRKSLQRSLQDTIQKCDELQQLYQQMCEILEVNEEHFYENPDFKQSQKLQNYMDSQTQINNILGRNLILREEVRKMEKQLANDKYDLNYIIESKKQLKNENQEQNNELKDKSKQDIQEEINNLQQQNQTLEVKFNQNNQTKINAEICLEGIFYKTKLISSLSDDFELGKCNLNELDETLQKRLTQLKTQLSEQQYMNLVEKEDREDNDILKYLEL